MEKFAVDLDKVLDEFEFNEDRAEQMATLVAKRTGAGIPPVVGGTLLHQPASSCYHRPSFEPINLADADFAADPQMTVPQYNNGFTPATNSTPEPSTDESNDMRLRSDSEWSQLSSCTFHTHSTIEKRTQNAHFSTDFVWQPDATHDRSETSKLNVSGVFSSLNEYLNAGNIEAKLGDVNVINNQTSWTAIHRLGESEGNGNFASSRNDTKENTDSSSALYHPVSSSTEVEKENKGSKENDTNELGLTSDKWGNTIDICKISTNNTQSSFADLIPVAYSRSLQEEADISGQSVSEHTSSDETPDLLDTTINSGKLGSLNLNHTNSQIKAMSVNDESPTTQFSSSSDLDGLTSADQSSMTSLPDVATCSAPSDVGVTDSESGLDLVSHRLDAEESNSDAVGIGFNAADTLSDAELHKYLQELEESDQEHRDDDGRESSGDGDLLCASKKEETTARNDNLCEVGLQEKSEISRPVAVPLSAPKPADSVTVSTNKSKPLSVITSVVSIDCQQITEAGDHACQDGEKKSVDEVELSQRNEEQSEIESTDLITGEVNSPDDTKIVPDSEKEDGIPCLKNNSSFTLNNLPLNEGTNCVVGGNDLGTTETISSLDDSSSLTKVSQEFLTDFVNGIPDNCTLVKENLNEQSKNSRPIDMDVSEVQNCLVRVPRDGSTINVLGEEERPSRPKYLFLPSKITVENEQDSENSEESPPISGAVDISESSVEQAMSPVPSLQVATPLSDDMSDILSPEERSLGKLPPFWVPDADAPNCMQCEIKFTVLKRRHHCRACGKVLCSKCCSLKARLEYMDNAEARVCQPCYTTLAKVFLVEQGESASGSPSSLNEGIVSVNTPLGRQPNPNNPMEYCSTIPPLEQAASVLRQPPPSVLVPVGVLKREGSTRSRSDVAKQVIFSDGIRPGGDLTELDGSAEPRLPYRRPGRVLKRVGTPPGPPSSASNHSSQRLLPPLDPKTLSYIPTDKGLPPLAVINKGEVKFEEIVDHDKQMAALRCETSQPAVFAINRNLFVQVKILNLDCCVNRTCWCFSTCGMSCVGQDEVVIVLECLPDETTIPKDIFRHLNTLYQDASRGNTVSELGHSVFQGVPFLDSTDHGGFIYIRPSFQCLQKLLLPSSPYLVAILVHRWEMPWATVFPIRLMLRLGAEYRYYPCMLVSIRNRRPVYWEIGHTIINLLADFRNLSYTLPSVRGLVIHMEDRQTSILLPKNRYDQVTRALNNSNDHVLALASNFSFLADSHLVCIQSNRDESYHTQAINIHNKPRKVTGASFVVFNGALKASSNLTAKSSIVEDGLMVQITSDTMQALRGALRNMQDFCIGCGPAGASQPDELVNMKWVQDDRNFNVGVKSSIDGRALDGVPSIRVHNGTDYMGSCRFIRWTEVFILQSDEGSGRNGDPLDISRLSESLARATCLALIKLLDLLAQAGLTKIAVRATVHPENVGYEAGSKGEKLPPIYMDSLDNELVPVLHKAASMSQDSSAAVLELIFHVMLQ
ncbi:zinc finger FYVE domain-containing protein 16 isoform X2 [Periplaneta americana]|uniref:zinc finger FYVE domain-containing protein 16 isoform X2 n=1 Tax=Periplaneta americana TaxID=6978 RepID=UPI0037E81220